MNPQRFAFPPPPPPPPKTQPANQPSYGQPPYEQPGYGASNRGRRGNRGSGNYRGRARNDGYGGSRGGGQVAGFGSSGQNNYYGSGQQTYTGYGQTGQGSYGMHNPTIPTNYPQFPQPQTPSYSGQVPHPTYYQPPQTYNQPLAQPSPVRPSGYNQSYSTPGPYASSSRPPSRGGVYSPQSPVPLPAQPQSFSPQPQMMGPPIRMGFDDNGGRDSRPNQSSTMYQNTNPWEGFGSRQGQQSGNMRHQPPSQNFSYPRGQKRGHSMAFGRQQNTRPPSASAVPSFVNPSLPKKPPPPIDEKRPKKKRRKQNLLGLTPRNEEHESSEEDDEDEETKLAQTISSGQHFTYKGQTATLGTPADIAAWIEERKKRFPTEARIKESKERQRQQNEERKKARQKAEEDRRKAKQKIKEERENAAKAHREKLEETKKLKDQTFSTEDIVLKAQLKAEKLRKKVLKEGKRLAKAEAKAEKARLQAEAAKEGPMPAKPSGQPKRKREGSDHDDSDHETKIEVADNPEASSNISTPTPKDSLVEMSTISTSDFSASIPNPKDLNDNIRGESANITLVSVGHVQNDAKTEVTTQLENEPLAMRDDLNSPPVGKRRASPRLSQPGLSESGLDTSSLSLSSSDESASSDDDDDSSDDSTSSDSSSDSDSDDSGPSVTTSKRTAGPEKVAPPSRDSKKQKFCHAFMRTGRCRRGRTCKFSHEVPEKSKGTTCGRREEKTKKRKNLYQVFVKKEQEEMDRKCLDAIVWLGQRGALDEKPRGIDIATRERNEKEEVSEIECEGNGVTEQPILNQAENNCEGDEVEDSNIGTT
ncbi:MAG: hypothetical protein M1834_005150 [Cirrosporium novae-zelandiae]|nr:MAG: hypothetical protein M1834_005150 [Cirrosporium novae-zelandiae]